MTTIDDDKQWMEKVAEVKPGLVQLFGRKALNELLTGLDDSSLTYDERKRELARRMDHLYHQRLALIDSLRGEVSTGSPDELHDGIPEEEHANNTLSAPDVPNDHDPRQQYMTELRQNISGFAAERYSDSMVKSLEWLLHPTAQRADIDLAYGRRIIGSMLESEYLDEEFFAGHRKATQKALHRMVGHQLPDHITRKSLSAILSWYDEPQRLDVEKDILSAIDGMAQRIRVGETNRSHQRASEDMPHQTTVTPASMPRRVTAVQPEGFSPETVEGTDTSQELVEDVLQRRETNYIKAIFGDEAAERATTEQRPSFVRSINEMSCYRNKFKNAVYDSYEKRLRLYFSEMTYSEIAEAAGQMGYESTEPTQRTFYSRIKRQVSGKFTVDQAQMVLKFIENGEDIDWAAVESIAADQYEPDPVATHPIEPVEETPVIETETVSREDMATTKPEQMIVTGEQRFKTIDVFSAAYRPPAKWNKHNAFRTDIDGSLNALIQQAVDGTQFSYGYAQSLQTQLGLPLKFQVDTQTIGERDVLDYLAALKESHPGRLTYAKSDKRVEAMSHIFRQFTIEKKTAHALVDLYSSPEALLLLKGAVAEVLRTSINDAPLDKKRWANQEATR